MKGKGKGKDKGKEKNGFSGQCDYCGKTGHTASECHWKDVECAVCGKRGHTADICRNKGKEGKDKTLTPSPTRSLRATMKADQWKCVSCDGWTGYDRSKCHIA